MSLLTVEEWANDYGGTGTITGSMAQLAIDLAEFEISEALLTFLVPTTLTEEYMWPGDNGKILLNHRYVTEITELLAKHSLDINCEWIQDDECGVILNSEEGLIQAVGTNFSLGNCRCGADLGWLYPDRMVITFVSGYPPALVTSTTALGKTLRMAIALIAMDKADFLSQGSNWQGNYNIASWNSMDYSERRDFGQSINNQLGSSSRAIEAWRILKGIKGYAAIVLKGSGRY